jgi:serine/threonine-protein kinase
MADCICLNPACLSPENPQDALFCKSCQSSLLIRNRYRAFRRIGQGGFGATFLARDQDLPSKPWRVIKQLRPANNSPQIARLAQELFNREAQVLERLGEHSQIPKLYAHFEEEGKFYLVQEYIQGVTLSKELQNTGPMSEEQVKQIMQEILLILSYVHSNNTVHRDIKPANLIRRKEDQRLVLIDFGAVKELGPNQKPQADMAIRSLGFSPPEQISGKAAEPASDIYALAATCLNLLTMESPAKFLNSETNEWFWGDRLTLTPEFEGILVKMLEPELEERYRTATDVLRALIALKDDSKNRPVIVLPTNPVNTETRISNHWSSRKSSGFTNQPIFTSSTLTRQSISAPSVGGGSRSSSSSSSRVAPPKPSLAGSDLRGKVMVGENLVGQDLRHADIRGTDLSGANLQRCDLRGVIFNTPAPPVIRLLQWIGSQARILGIILLALGIFFGAGILGFWGINLVSNSLVLAFLGAAVGCGIAWTILWSLVGRFKWKSPAQERPAFTLLRKTDLRGAQLDEKLKAFARQQGALL